MEQAVGREGNFNLISKDIVRAIMSGERSCMDSLGRPIAPGNHYVPGPGPCTFCICEDGLPKSCKPVLCYPPQECKSYRAGPSCCEFYCLDYDFKGDSQPELSLRYVASAIAFILVVCIGMFFIIRIRRRKMRTAVMTNDDRNMSGIGYIAGMGYEREDNNSGYPGYKPTYAPRGEAPPPYDEVVAQARVDQMRLAAEQRNAIVAHSMAMENSMRHEAPPRPVSAHLYGNTVRSLGIGPQQPNPNHTFIFNAPLIQPNHGYSDSQEPHSLPILPSGARIPLRMQQPYNLPDLVRLGVKAASSGAAMTFPTGSLGTITNRGLINVINRNPHFNSAHSASLHRTIPRFSTTADNLIDHADPAFVRASRLQYLEMRRSFHRPSERPPLADNSSSIPGNLDLTSRSEECFGLSDEQAATSSRFTMKQFHQNFVDDATRGQKGTVLQLMGLFNDMLPAPERVHVPELPTNVDKPSCLCYANQTTDDGDPDEYHSACENCKSANSSRWVLESEYGYEDEDGTQTLQRRAPPSAAPVPAAATLPQPLTKQRSNPGLSSNWENWFTAIDDSSSSDED